MVVIQQPQLCCGPGSRILLLCPTPTKKSLNRGLELSYPKSRGVGLVEVVRERPDGYAFQAEPLTTSNVHTPTATEAQRVGSSLAQAAGLGINDGLSAACRAGHQLVWTLFEELNTKRTLGNREILADSERTQIGQRAGQS